MIGITISVLSCLIVYPRISTDSLACFLRNTKATTIPAKREFTTCPVFAQTASKARSYQPCAVMRTCYYKYYVIFLLFFSSLVSLLLMNKIVIIPLPLFHAFYSIVKNKESNSSCRLQFNSNPYLCIWKCLLWILLTQTRQLKLTLRRSRSLLKYNHLCSQLRSQNTLACKYTRKILQCYCSLH